jgi:6-pyruvoyltetrahydropterin/6-carboxytetrahydropterin synthase
MFELTVNTDFAGAHYLPGYQGKCQRLHGHNWRVTIAVKGENLNDMGMLLDFKEIKNELNKVISSLDHHYLNELEPFSTVSPTSENIARYIFLKLQENLQTINNDIHVSKVTVWESANSAVTYYQEG